MRYVNIRTGSVIETNGIIRGGDWREEPASTEAKLVPEETEKPKRTRKTKK